ncbi:hypothetical protein D3C87_1930760 [compost metagenome]
MKIVLIGMNFKGGWRVEVKANGCNEDGGVFELKVMHIFEEDTDHFGIISLEKLYGESVDNN